MKKAVELAARSARPFVERVGGHAFMSTHAFTAPLSADLTQSFSSSVRSQTTAIEVLHDYVDTAAREALKIMPLQSRKTINALITQRQEKISFKISDDADKGELLKCFSSNEGKHAVVRASVADSSAANVFVFGSITADNTHAMAATHKGVELLCDASSPEQLSSSGAKSVLYYPERTIPYRDVQTLEWHKDKNHTYLEISNFATRTLLPRLLTKDGKLADPHSIAPITFYTFSYGGKMVSMAENALRAELRREYRLPDEQIKEYFNRFRRISIGMAPDWNHLPSLRFPNITVLSIDDMITRRTPDIHAKIFTDPNVMIQPYSCFTRAPQSEKDTDTDHLIVLGHGQVPAQYAGRVNELGHGHSMYVRGIVNTLPSGFPQLFAEMLKGATSEHISSRMGELFCNSTSYNPYDIPPQVPVAIFTLTAGEFKLKTAWARSLLEESLAAEQLKLRHGIFSPGIFSPGERESFVAKETEREKTCKDQAIGR